MNALYSDARSEKSLCARLAVNELLKDAVDHEVRLEWAPLKSWLVGKDCKIWLQRAAEKLAGDTSVIEVPNVWKFAAAPRHQFVTRKALFLRAPKTPAGLATPQDASDSGVAKVIASSSGGVDELNYEWVVTKFKGAGRVHVLDMSGDPHCRRRRRVGLRKFKAVYGAGTGLQELRVLGRDITPCPGCRTAVPAKWWEEVADVESDGARLIGADGYDLPSSPEGPAG